MITHAKDQEAVRDIARQMESAQPIFVAYIIRAGIETLYGKNRSKWPEHTIQTYRQLRLWSIGALK